MAVDMCSADTSPRISFSHDFCQPFAAEPRSDYSLLDPNPDFAFCVQHGGASPSAAAESHHTADELFCNGLLLPIQLPTTTAPRSPPRENEASNPPPPPPENPGKRQSLNGDESSSAASDGGSDEKPRNETASKSSSSFWRFYRSSSSRHQRASMICPLPLLSRSYSTGSSAAGPRRTTSSTKDRQSSSGLVSAAQKRASRRTYEGMSVTPVLNTPRLLGLGSLFRNKENNKERKRQLSHHRQRK